MSLPKLYSRMAYYLDPRDASLREIRPGGSQLVCVGNDGKQFTLPRTMSNVMGIDVIVFAPSPEYASAIAHCAFNKNHGNP